MHPLIRWTIRIAAIPVGFFWGGSLAIHIHRTTQHTEGKGNLDSYLIDVRNTFLFGGIAGAFVFFFAAWLLTKPKKRPLPFERSSPPKPNQAPEPTRSARGSS